MKKSKRGGRKPSDLKDAGSDDEGVNQWRSRKQQSYEPSDSDEEYGEHDKILLGKVRSQSSRSNQVKKMAVMNLPSDDESESNDSTNDNEFDNMEDMDSDIEGKDDDGLDLPNQRAWGKTRKNYYNTDYVDQDYGGFDGEDAEAAEVEEQEAREIQQRLAAELDDADFTLNAFSKDKGLETSQKLTETEEVIKTDLSQLTTREKLALLQKEAPELTGIVTEFKEIMKDVLHCLHPALVLVQEDRVKSPQLAQYIRTKFHLSNNYAMNMGFYLLLRARRLPVTAHPVVKRLLQYRQLLQQLQPLDDIASTQIQELLQAAKDGTLPVTQGPDFIEKKQRKQLKLVSCKTATHVEDSIMDIDIDDCDIQSQKKKSKNTEKMHGTKVPWNDSVDSDKDQSWGESEDDDNDNADANEVALADEEDDRKRAITWQMAKNKGLTPRRKKEQANPRVKHRNKFRKAQVRRKGQVREPRTEIKRYGGEMTGIKSTVTKSVKIK